jgi:sporulation protein YlmC with PRC-barrel domain
MLRSWKEITGYDILAADGKVGKVYDFYFDGKEWVVRYLVVDTGPWILGRKVLIIPSALTKPDWNTQTLPVNLTREQVKNSPDVNTRKTVSQQELDDLHNYYGWPKYRSPIPPVTGAPPKIVEESVTSFDPQSTQANVVKESERMRQPQGDANLRIATEVVGYKLVGKDGYLGKVDDFILDDNTWNVRYLVLDTNSKEKLEGKKTLIAPLWIHGIRHTKAKINIDLEKKDVENSPVFDPEAPINRKQEEVLYDYHGRSYYWTERSQRKE